MDRASGKKPQEQDVVDKAEYARALRATMFIKSPDRSRSGSAANFGGSVNEDEDLAKAIAASLQYVPEDPSSRERSRSHRQELSDLTEEEMMAIAIAESANDARQSAVQDKKALSSTSTSAGGSKGKEKMTEVVVLDDSDTEQERAPPPASHHQNQAASSRANGKPVPQKSLAPVTSIPAAAPENGTSSSSIAAPAAATSAFLLNRRALEQERLERQKRLRGDVNAPQSSSDEEDLSEENDGADEDRRAMKRRKLDPQVPETNRAATAMAQAGSLNGSRDQISASENTRPDPQLFLDGEVRLTWNRHVHDARPRFRIGDIFGDTEDLSLVIASSYCHEAEWISRHFPDPALVPTIHIRQPRINEENDKWIMETAETAGGLPGSATVWAFMPYIGRGTMHMKFMLLFHKSGRLRVVISSANLMSYDWQDIENVIFVQDLRPVSANTNDPTAVTADMPGKFQLLFARNMKIEKPLKHLKQYHPFGSDIPLDVTRNLATLGKWDWSRVSAELVVSIPGKEIGEANVGRNGMGGLAACLRRRGWVPGRGQELAAEFQSSSLTNFTTNFMWNFYDCMRGKTAVSTTSASRPKKSKAYPPIKVLFPSLRTVMNSELGPPGAGTMFCREGHFTADTKDLFYDANCKAGRVMMHTKCILATFRPGGQVGNSIQNQFARGSTSAAGDSKSSVGGWFYVGSHNFSSAAWGTMSMPKTGGQPQIYVQNYEMGVVLPLPVDDTERAATEFAMWLRPPRKYDKDSDKPWMQDQFRMICERGPAAINAEVSRYAL
ncbi:hypothetical protein NliqN6_0069 [Naganishia liquefaciens]|uniref:Uncharacterized protein n=1 Tax=Naganishia liquefaciens TaxID=104408 RepID=A0A8H3YCW2_9TREE|nr:hypothetical protein NliqN6_0069 [Naganishia liquefaciens]